MEEKSKEGEKWSWMEKLECEVFIVVVEEMVCDRVLRFYVLFGVKYLGEGEGEGEGVKGV